MIASIQTYTGKEFFLLEPRAEDVDVQDIAYSLSGMGRFTCHCRPRYSVAEHAVRVCDVLAALGYCAKTQFRGLHHDSPEAYTGDLSSPLKHIPQMLAVIKPIEKRIMCVIADAFGMPRPEPKIVKRCDDTLFATEWRDLMLQGRIKHTGRPKVVPLSEKIRPWGERRARREFLARHEMLMRALVR